MKKYLICAVLILMINQVGYAQDAKQLLSKYSNAKDIESVNIGSFMMKLGKTFGGIGDTPVARGVNSIQILEFSSCSQKIKDQFTSDVKKLKDGSGYETLIQVKNRNEGLRIMVKKEKDVIREIVLFCHDKNDPTIIKLSGKIKESDLAELVEKYEN